jgi:hypothetical protein
MVGGKTPGLGGDYEEELRKRTTTITNSLRSNGKPPEGAGEKSRQVIDGELWQDAVDKKNEDELSSPRRG